MELLDSISLWEFDESYLQNYRSVCGVDEVGRGPLAGPLVACAVLWDSLPFEVIAVNDSKKLSDKKRRTLFFKIISSCVAFSFGVVSVREMRNISMHQVNLLAMKRALLGLPSNPGIVLIDGKWVVPGYKRSPQQAIVKGDCLSAAIASASILAKVFRDRIMLALDRLYPQYGFARHKGYATEEHYRALHLFGLTSEHRLNFGCLKIFIPDG